MLDPHWLMRMARWARNPPSWGAFRFLLLIVVLCAALYAVDLIWGWPEALTPERINRRMPGVPSGPAE